MKLSDIIAHAHSAADVVCDLFATPLPLLAQQAEKIGIPHRRQFFAPIYISNVCASHCAYCAFHAGSGVKRITLTREEASQEANFLKGQGYNGAYCLSGSWTEGSVSQIGSMAEVNSRGLAAIHRAGLFPILESSPFGEQNLRTLLKIVCGEGRYVLFQETYDPELYLKHHAGDPFKGNPDDRIDQMMRAVRAGWKEIGIGALLGLSPNLRQELACLIAHTKLLEEQGVRVTVSVPRQTAGTGVTMMDDVGDEDFLRAVYTLRVALPEVSIVLTGRETPDMRDRLWPVTDIWGVRGSTVPGGYTLGRDPANGQFTLTDRRTIGEILSEHA